jgi:hypothetical protein
VAAARAGAMSPRTTAVLALLVAALGAFVWFYEVKGGEERHAEEELSKRLFRDVKADEITLVTLTTKDGKEARLERVGGAWKILAPIAFPADATAADGIAETLAQLTSDTVIAEPEPPAEYGLAAPPKVRFRAGDRELALRIGDRAPVGAATYVATAADEPVYTVQSFRVASLDKTLDELRERRPLRFDREAAAELRVRWKGGAARAVRDEEAPDAWHLVEPLRAEADAAAIDKALSDLEFLRAAGFDDAPDSPQRKALEDPVLSIEVVSRADGKESSVRFALGPPDPDGKRAAQTGTSDTVYQLAAGALEDFPRTVDAFRKKTLSSYVPDEARRFELAFHAEGAGESLLITGRREGDAWTTEPEAMKPDAAAQLVRELSGLEGAKIAAETLGEKERAALGLAPPRALIRVFGGPDPAKDEALAEVHLGVGDEKRGIAAKRADRETIFWLPWERHESIPTSLEAFRERFVAAADAPAAPADAAPAPIEEPPPAP